MKKWYRIAKLTTPDEILKLWEKEAEKHRKKLHSISDVTEKEAYMNKALEDLENIKDDVLEYYRCEYGRA